MVPAFLQLLNRLLRLATFLFFVVVALGVAAVLALMAASLLTQDKGSEWLQALIQSDGFLPWPVAAMFSLMEHAPWMVGIGLAGAIVRAVLRRLLLAQCDQDTLPVAKVFRLHYLASPTTMRSMKPMWVSDGCARGA